MRDARPVLTISSGEELAAGFQRIPNRRLLPDYFDIIAEPIAFSTIRVRYTVYHCAAAKLLT